MRRTPLVGCGDRLPVPEHCMICCLSRVTKMGGGRGGAGSSDGAGRGVICRWASITVGDCRFLFLETNPVSRRDNQRRSLSWSAPVALQDLLVSISFLAITAIVNQLGVIASAGVGVAEKVWPPSFY